MAPKQVRHDQRKELHAICALIEARRSSEEFRYGTAEDLAKAACHSVSTWHAWRRARPTSPKYFDLRDFLRAVGLDLKIQASNGEPEAWPGGLDVKPETAEVARLMDKLPDEARAALRDAVHEKLAEIVAKPPAPGGLAGGPAGRR